MDNTELIIRYIDEELSVNEEKQFENNLFKNPELMHEYQLHMHLNNYMKSKFMYEQDENNDFFKLVNQFAQEAVKDYKNDDTGNTDIIDFLNAAKNKKEISMEEKMMHAETEAYENGIDSLAHQWVKEWNEVEKDTDYFKEIKAFVVSGMKLDEKEGKQKLNVVKMEKASGKLRFLNKWYYVAASIAAIFIIAIGLWNLFDSPVSNSTLFASYYHPYTLISNQTRSAETNGELSLNKVTELYNSQDYAEASGILKNMLKADNKNVKVRFIYALTQIENQNYLKAAEEFNYIILKHNHYKIESSWYLALCYLKMGKTERAIVLLKGLTQSKNYYQKPALDILAKIK